MKALSLAKSPPGASAAPTKINTNTKKHVSQSQGPLSRKSLQPSRAFSHQEPSAIKSLQPSRAFSQKEPSAIKSPQPSRAFSQKEPSAKKSLQPEGAFYSVTPGSQETVCNPNRSPGEEGQHGRPRDKQINDLVLTRWLSTKTVDNSEDKSKIPQIYPRNP